MKKLLLIGLICCFIKSFSQFKSDNSNILFGSISKSRKKMEVLNVFHLKDSSIVLIKKEEKHNGKYFVEHYNRELQKLKTTVFNAKWNDKPLENLIFQELNDTIYLFSHQNLKKVDQLTVYCQKLAAPSFYPTPPKVIHTFKVDKNIIESSIEYEIISNKSRNEIGFYSNYRRTDIDSSIVDIDVYDLNLKVKWSKYLKLPYIAKYQSIENLIFDENGNFNVLYRTYGLIKFREHSSEHTNAFPYYIISEKGLVPNNFDIDIEDRYIHSIKMVQSTQGELIFSGFFSESDENTIEGYFFIKLDSEAKKLLVQQFEKFDLDFITSYTPSYHEKKILKKAELGEDFGLSKFEILDVVPKDSGGVFILAEQTFQKNYDTPTINSNVNYDHTTKYYFYNDVLVVSVLKTGELQWADKIPKRQMTRNDEGIYSSFVQGQVNEQLYFIYNDNSDNLIPLPQFKLKAFSHSHQSMLAIVRYDSDGRKVKESLLLNEWNQPIVNPSISKQTLPNEFIFVATKPRSTQIIRVTFQ